MNSRNVLQTVIGLAIVTLLVIGCGPQETVPAATSVSEAPAVAPTSVPPTPMPTPVPPTATPTPVPSTPASTPIPPTPTPECRLECTASTEPSLDIRITCESGKFSAATKSWEEWDDDKDQWVTIVTSESDEISESVKIWKEWDDDKNQWVTHFKGERTYDDSGNTYEITAYAWSKYVEDAWAVRYHIEVIGGVFGETPQACGTD